MGINLNVELNIIYIVKKSVRVRAKLRFEALKGASKFGKTILGAIVR